MNKKIIVIGGGPAGMMAAVKAAENGAEVTVLEKMGRAGKKMLITGKGRCNITNASEVPELISHVMGNGAFLNSSMRAFDNRDVIRFFEEAGVPTKVERGNRVFPASDRAADVVDAMLAKLHELGVHVVTETAVKEILVADGAAVGARAATGEEWRGDAVILAVGGASYPGTGSAGDGYAMAKRLGHSIVRILPALVPLETEEEWVREAQGLSLRNVRAALFADGKKEAELFGEMMFTHFGVTGPIVLSLSRRAAEVLEDGAFVELVLNLKPALTPETLDARVQRDFLKYVRKRLKNGLQDLLPGKMIAPVLDAAYLDPDKPVHEVTQEERARLVDALRHLPLTVTKTRPLSEAIVTAGGVSVKEINPKTMESKLVPGLYFAGEVVDVDACTGGYNLQAAFSMGAAAGCWSVWNEKTGGVG